LARTILFTTIFVSVSNAQMEEFTRAARPFNKDVPYVSCEVCKRAVAEVYRIVEESRKVAPYGKLGEEEMMEVTENICNPETDEGTWIQMEDLSQSKAGMSIKLITQDMIGECRRECRTIEKACGNVFDEYREDLAELLYKSQKTPMSLEKISSRVCTKWSKVCPAKTVPASYKRKDEYWMPMDEESYKIHSMEKQMNKLSKQAVSQPVKFVDPMGGMMMGSNGWDEEENGWEDPMMNMMGGMGMGGYDGYGDEGFDGYADDGEF